MNETVQLSPPVTSQGDNNRVEGVVEILYNKRWGYICRPPGNELDDVAEAVCQGLGYQREDSRVINTPPAR